MPRKDAASLVAALCGDVGSSEEGELAAIDIASLTKALEAITPEALAAGCQGIGDKDLNMQIYNLVQGVRNADGGDPASQLANAHSLKFKPMDPVCEAAEQGDLPTLTHLLATGRDVNAIGENGNSALAFACANGHADCTSLLISKRASVDQPSNLGNTPLHAACWADSPKCIRILLDAGAKINQRSDANGATPLHVAVQGNRDEAVALLLARNADPLARTRDGTAESLARKLGHDQCLKVIRRHREDNEARAQVLLDAQRKEAEAKANAAYELLMAELDAEEKASGGGQQKKKESKSARKKAKAKAAADATVAAAAAAAAKQPWMEQGQQEAPQPIASSVAAPADVSDADEGSVGALVRAAAGGGGDDDDGSRAGNAAAPDPALDLDVDAAMANALINGNKARRRRGVGGSTDGSGGDLRGGGVGESLADRLRKSAFAMPETGADADARDDDSTPKSSARGDEDDLCGIRRSAARCPRCGSRARMTKQGRCPSCFADLQNPAPAPPS